MKINKLEEGMEIIKEVEPLIPHDHFKCVKCGRILPNTNSKCRMSSVGAEIMCTHCYNNYGIEVP